MSEYRIQSETLEGIADAIRGKTGGSALIAPEDMADEIDGLATVTNGIVYSDVRSDGKPTVVDFYGEIAPVWQFSGAMYGGLWKYLKNASLHGTKIIGYECFLSCDSLESVTGLENITQIGQGAFQGCKSLSQSIVIPSSVGSELVGTAAFSGTAITSVVDNHQGRINGSTYSNCASLQSYRADKVTSFWGDHQFYNCSSLEEFSMGSIGYGVSEIQSTNTFGGCTNPLLNMVFYTKANYVDTLLEKVRAGATNATIVIKASVETTYSGTTYSAGDTILTSEVESNES